MERTKRLSVGFTEQEVNQITNFASKLRIPPTQMIREFAMKYIEEQSAEELNKTYSFKDAENDIINAVCKGFHVTKTEITRKVRKRYIVDARMCVAYMMRHRLGYGVSEIGRILKKHYATVIHMLKESEALIEVDKHFKNRYEKALNLLESESN